MGLLAAHDIPRDLTVHAYLKPSGRTLQLLVRVPLQSMRDIEFPQRGPGFLDFDRADPLLKDAAQLWIAGAVHLYENYCINSSHDLRVVVSPPGGGSGGLSLMLPP